MSASYLDSTPDRSQAICDLPFCRAPPDRLARSRARARPILRTHTHAHVVTKHSVKMAAIMNISAAAKVCKAPKVRFERAPARRFPGRIDRDAPGTRRVPFYPDRHRTPLRGRACADAAIGRVRSDATRRLRASLARRPRDPERHRRDEPRGTPPPRRPPA